MLRSFLSMEERLHLGEIGFTAQRLVCIIEKAGFFIL